MIPEKKTPSSLPFLHLRFKRFLVPQRAHERCAPMRPEMSLVLIHPMEALLAARIRTLVQTHRVVNFPMFAKVAALRKGLAASWIWTHERSLTSVDTEVHC